MRWGTDLRDVSGGDPPSDSDFERECVGKDDGRYIVFYSFDGDKGSYEAKEDE